MTAQEFTQKYYPLAKKATAGTGIYPETVLAIAMIESRRADSLLSKKYNNYFGIKAGNTWKGKSVNLKTNEYYNSSSPTVIKDNFRAYSSAAQSFKDFVLFIEKNARYKKALTAKNYGEQITAIAAAGYATAPSYKNTITAAAEQVEKFLPMIKEIAGKNKALLILGVASFTAAILISNTAENGN